MFGFISDTLDHLFATGQADEAYGLVFIGIVILMILAAAATLAAFKISDMVRGH